MIEISTYNEAGFRILHRTPGWRVAFLRYTKRFSAFTELERHLTSDEAFVLLCGSATLYTDTEQTEMKPNTVYNIPAGVWHHITVSQDATVLVIENDDVSAENSEKRALNGGELTC